MAQLHNPVDLNLKHHCSESLKTLIVLVNTLFKCGRNVGRWRVIFLCERTHPLTGISSTRRR